MTDRPTPTVPPDRLETRFHDKNPPLTGTEAQLEATRCLYCWDAPCIRACPTAIDIPTFIRKIATGNVAGSARTIYQANLLGASCARVCPVEVLCEGKCVYNEDGRRPISIGRLQRFATENGPPPRQLLTNAPPTGKTIGLVGGGPASLACAGALALLGHDPVIYEKADVPGGLNSTGVAPYKLKLDDALEEVRRVLELGVRVKTGVRVGEDVTAQQLLDDHDAIFLGPGLGRDSRLGVPGENGPGVEGAVAWIDRMKTASDASVDGVKRAVVVGGGNTAIDVARELRGLGVESVTIVYRRAASRMSAYEHELSAAKAEGARVIDRASVSELVRTNGRVSGVRLVETEDGRPTAREITVLPADFVILAIGQARLQDLATAFPGVACDSSGRIVADPETGRTGNPRVFAGGDARNGGKEVVNAVQEGQDAARAIDRLLREGA